MLAAVLASAPCATDSRPQRGYKRERQAGTHTKE